MVKPRSLLCRDDVVGVVDVVGETSDGLVGGVACTGDEGVNICRSTITEAGQLQLSKVDCKSCSSIRVQEGTVGKSASTATPQTRRATGIIGVTEGPRLVDRLFPAGATGTFQGAGVWSGRVGSTATGMVIQDDLDGRFLV